MTTHFRILAWEIPWTEEPGGLQSIRLQRVRHDLVTKQWKWQFCCDWLQNFSQAWGSERWSQPTCSKPRNPSLGGPSVGLWQKPLGSRETSPSLPLTVLHLSCRAWPRGPRGTSVFLHSLPFMCANKIRDGQVDTCIYSHLLGQTDIYLLLYKWGKFALSPEHLATQAILPSPQRLLPWERPRSVTPHPALLEDQAPAGEDLFHTCTQGLGRCSGCQRNPRHHGRVQSSVTGRKCLKRQVFWSRHTLFYGMVP